MSLLRDTLMLPELRISSENIGAVSGDDAGLLENRWSDEPDEVLEDVSMLDPGLLRFMAFSWRASTSLKLSRSWPC